MLHIWWTCTQVQPYWTQIAEIIRGATGCILEHNAETFLLKLLPTNIPHSITKLMFLTLTSASTLLAKHWEKKQIPSTAEVTAMVTTTLDYEVILWNQTKIGKGSATAKKIWTTYTEKKNLQAAARDNANTDTTTKQ
ncbi:Hypothetical predicted protein [Pelobates cultripes]|uniref:Uncharacterized protein n=1 Tax=Pelobates cultripes TaxID=61616 RepID=A0AAD1VNI6_PELCU|nr:Hypothetical predicted protein [Pelobates cultripes]